MIKLTSKKGYSYKDIKLHSEGLDMNSSNAWMLFNKWLLDFNCDMVKKNHITLLLLLITVQHILKVLVLNH